MNIRSTTLKDVIEIIPNIFSDERGFFFESFNENTWKKQGLPYSFKQDNQSYSIKNVVRGLHFQTGEHAQGKLVRVIKGRVLDIALDLRQESPTFGKYELFDLDSESGKMIYIPEGFAHGFAALEDSIFHYKCTGEYCKSAEAGIHWNDSSLKIPWEVDSPIVSLKDQMLPTFEEYLQGSYSVN
ncbi:dTDP-4-dehydrorhamnose 3,5-epimerase [Dyadobacter pollutisoli]|uniref:dTDP-4-dehydrorhamnose 3,5-epimerase n=1 Tax=Dyadobacter pollutisoli TaxID=2910158 RepID=A0A9E8SQM8_9BACT|nr:dTDP-4-dehydrorhamnose 3,5-epimerase [Dyadobacter pollutisoli]WAC13217.1 dTDP-4-dehydrorhamnose 3,5-epimerase [Dyadobacter pollutisoli]